MNQIWGSMEQYSTLVWHWPIAIYLFLAGLSAGAAMTSLIVKWIEGNGKPPWDGLIKAGAILAPVTICLGLFLLIFDLTRPLMFWKLLIHYNFGSVMTLGVLALFIYTPLSFIYTAIKFKPWLFETGPFAGLLKPFRGIIESIGDNPAWLERTLFLFAVIIGIYTGFLLSAMYSYPLFNTPLLPILFLASGLSSGVAASILFGLLFFKSEVNEKNAKYLLELDLRVVPMELLLLFALFVGMYFQGGDKAIIAIQAMTTGIWAFVFWFGVIGVGIATPLLIAVTALKHHAYRVGYILLNSVVVLIGVIFLRLYILYAGQTFVG
ncbi:NrfD/PsrC family molybdoenzyme membrane anchor subunit [Sulfurospirillum halorespirans]|uniref:Polysulfide reductase, subunit C n=1 Tax=Sulfurospirillum halorespirans DSM 13726 TaxID=1193502 RepID=A0A1D7TGI7_9BACT|nr:NrfD/PsrC family molybdoenzyme membrane anchor subunit [Sulfurospirillum halorespirans]AOO64106.1 polysulfide reductase, subunit C [Sulfurospirillum halorespirans DSM 13726]